MSFLLQKNTLNSICKLYYLIKIYQMGNFNSGQLTLLNCPLDGINWNRWKRFVLVPCLVPENRIDNGFWVHKVLGMRDSICCHSSWRRCWTPHRNSKLQRNIIKGDISWLSILYTPNPSDRKYIISIDFIEIKIYRYIWKHQVYAEQWNANICTSV